MSRRRANKRKGIEEAVAIDDSDGEERKEDKRSRVEPAAAAAASSSSAAAAAASSSPFAASGPAFSVGSSGASAAASSSHPLADLEKLECPQCKDSFECTDASGLMPRNLPCGHVLCSTCIKDNLSRARGSVRCPENPVHGAQQIVAPSAAEPTMADWLNQLQPAKDLIAAIRNQQMLTELLTRNQQQLTQHIEQQRVRCSYPDCASVVTHYCSDCGDLCSAHEQALHALEPFQSHKPKTVSTALKAEFLRDRQQSNMAVALRAQADQRAARQARETKTAEDELKQLEVQTQLQMQQLQKKRQEVEAKQKALGALKHTADQMRAANASTVLKLEADRLEAKELRAPAVAAVAVVRPAIDSAVLNALADGRVIALQIFLGPARPLSHATLIYRASRDGFKAEDWWRLCGGKSNLLTIVKVKRNGFVFGAFTPFRWPVEVLGFQDRIEDPTGATFLFSLVNAHGRAVKLRLKESQQQFAGSTYPGNGPIFCNGDLGLMLNGKSADSPLGNCTQPSSFEFDCVADGGAPIAYDKTLLAGDDGKGNAYVYSAAAEIETWQL